MAINSRTKGANFEREIGNLLQEKLSLTNPVKRILEQTRTKELPDLKMGRWCIECKLLFEITVVGDVHQGVYSVLMHNDI